MDISDPHCHTSSIAVRCSPETAFAYVSDGLRQGDWTLGSMDRKAVGDNLFTGACRSEAQGISGILEAVESRRKIAQKVNTVTGKIKRVCPPARMRSSRACDHKLRRHAAMRSARGLRRERGLRGRR